MKRSTIDECSLITLPRINNRAGNITAVENSTEIPFDVNRVFYIYDIPGGEDRGAHAHKECHQFLVAASGAFEVQTDDGNQKKTFSLNQPNYGLYIPPGIWAAEINFSSGAVCLVLTSHKYDEYDYIRDYRKFIGYKKHPMVQPEEKSTI